MGRFARSRMAPFPGSGGSTVLTDHDVTEELAAAFHDQADPVTRTALDPAGIFPRGARARRRRAALRVAGAGTTAISLAGRGTAARPGPRSRARPPRRPRARPPPRRPPPAAGSGRPP